MGLPNSRLTVWSYTFNFCWINYLIIEWHYSFFPWQPTDEAVNETSNNQQTDSMLFAGSLCGPLSESLNESMFILIISRWRLAFDSLKETNDTTLLSAAGSLVKIMVICFSLSPMFLFFIHSSMSWLESCMFPLQTCWWNWLGILLRIKCCRTESETTSLYDCGVFFLETLITWYFLSLHTFHVKYFKI